MPAALRRTLALLIIALSSAAVAQPVAKPVPEKKPAEKQRMRDLPVELTADALDYDAERQLYVASGNVEVVQAGRTVRADWVAFNRKTGIGVASGHVTMTQGGEVLSADFVQFDVNSQGGFARNGAIDSPVGQFRAAGAEIQKVGPDEYAFRGGVFTTCRCPKEGSRAPWRIRAASAHLRIGGYGTVRDATLDILDVPVFWMPWLIVPLRTERQTGFLLPELSFGSRSSFGIGIPFFWAARDNVNVTLTPRYSYRRGYKQDVKIETVLGRESSADLFGAYAYDLDVDPHTQREPYSKNRWSLLGNQDLFLPGDARYSSHVQFVSDNDYPIDFPELRPHRADRWLESVASLTRDFGPSGRLGALGVARYANDMQNPDDLDRDGSVLDRLPQLELAALPGVVTHALPWLVPTMDTEFIEFQAWKSPNGVATFVGVDPNDPNIPHNNGRIFLDTGPDAIFNKDERDFNAVDNTDPNKDDFAAQNPDDPNGPPIIKGGGEGDGKFEEGEPITDEGSRFRFYPRLGAPLPLAGFAEVYPELGWYQTLYTTRRNDFAQRGLPTARVDLRTRLRRQYGELTHVIEPTIGYAYVGADSQGGNPMLIPPTRVEQERIRSLDLDTVTNDPSDRIAQANRMTFGAIQRLHGTTGGDSETADGQPLGAELSLLGSYEFDDQRFGLVIADGGYAMEKYGATRASLGVDPGKERVSEALIDWRYRHEAGHRLWLGYRYLRQIPDVFEDFGTGERFDNFTQINHINQVFGDIRLQITQRWRAGYRLSYSFESDLLLQNTGFLEYLSKCGCWAAGMELGWDRASGFDYRLLYRLVGVGDEMGNSPLLDSLGSL